MFGVEANCAYVLVVGLLTLLVAVLVWCRHRTGKTVSVWLASAILGILLGMAGAFAGAHLAGFQLAKIPPKFDASLVSDDADAEEEGSGEEEGGGGRPAGRGGSRGPRPKRDLTTLVGKLELLTGDVAIDLSDKQAASLTGSLAGIETAETMSDEQAQAKHDEILALLDDDQKTRLDAVGLPGGFGGGSRGPGGGSAGPGGGGGPGGPDQDPEANPFAQEANAQTLTGLREQLAPAEKSDQDSPSQ